VSCSLLRLRHETCRAGFRPGQRARKLAELLNFSLRQLDQAVELIEDAAISPTALAAVFRTVSSDGLHVYLTTRNACACPASGPCFHRAGVTMVTAA
jgi:hypothetical protein